MDKVYKYIIQKTVTDKISKSDAVQLLDLLKKEKDRGRQMDIAVIGIAAKTSRANTTREFWHNLKNGVDCIRPIPEGRRQDLDAYMDFHGASERMKQYREIAYLEEIDKFDYGYFNLSPREAELMDPNQRMFLETAYTAIENAGYGNGRLRGTKTGLYLGFITSNYSYQHLLYEVDAAKSATALMSNLAALIPSRVSYQLDLRGPSILVDTTCSSSLVATHLACQAIRDGECEQAIVGGVKINLLPLVDGPKIGIESSTGRTLSFDDKSDGTGQGEGAGAVILKPLRKAIRDGDNIRAVIKGSAINQDGQSLSLTAPNTRAQTEVIMSAWESAQVDPTSVSYIEAHGTGTELGDPIEVEGITKAFRAFTDKKQFCAIGSVKSNIGHLDEAAGIFGLIKTILSLENKQIPPSINFDEPNHKIDWENSAVYVNSQLSNWGHNKKFPRRAGVSSFGLSGTNCHLVLEEAASIKTEKQAEKKNDLNLLTLSAKNKTVLNNLVNKYLNFVKQEKEIDLENLCYTANSGRGHYNLRLAIIFKDKDDLQKKLEYFSQGHYQQEKKSGVYFYSLGIEMLSNNEGKTELANKLLENLNKNDHSFWERLVELYGQGAEIDWQKAYSDKKYFKIDLPTYPFEKNRCWFKVPAPKKNSLHYGVGWRLENLKELPVSARTTLVFREKNKQSEKIFQQLLKEEGKEKIIEVELGVAFKKNNNNYYTVGEQQADFNHLIAALVEKKLDRIVFLPAVNEAKEEIEDSAQLKTIQEKGVMSLFRLTRALKKYLGASVIDIVLISELADSVTGQEKIIKPENILLPALGKSVFMEVPNFRCRAIDIDKETDSQKIVQEIKNEFTFYKIAYRTNKRYVEELRELNLKKIETRPFRLRARGVYVITGGGGEIGLRLAEFLAQKEKVKIVLINRTEFPSRESWQEIISKKKSADKNLINKLETFLRIEETGAEIFLFKADVASEAQIKKTIEVIKTEIGPIKGIVHAAGLAQEKYIEDKSEEEFYNILAAKVQGTWLLEHLTRDQNLDFFTLFSSAITFFGGLLASDYITANSFLDAYADYAQRKGVNVLSIAWPFWDGIGMHSRHDISENKLPLKNLRAQTAIDLWFDLLSKKINRVMAGELNYGSDVLYLSKYLLPFTFSREVRIRISSIGSPLSLRQTSEEVRLRGSKKNDYSQVEKEIAQIWAEVLGYNEIDVRDNFFELGGDSLFIAEIYSRLEKKYPGQISITQLFAYPTVAQLAQFLSKEEIFSGNQSPAKVTDNQDIAIIGMAAKTSLADNYQELWNNLLVGKNCIRKIPENRKADIDDYLRLAGIEERYMHYSPLAYLSNIDQFDYEFFKFSLHEAKLMDPNQRLFLETAVATLEDAGYGGDKLRGTKTGLYLGFGPSDFEYKDIVSKTKLPSSTAVFTGNLNALIPSRISYLLDLHGPSLVIDTACSSSLVSVYMACQGILSGDCEQAIAGGVRLNLLPLADRFKVGIESSDWQTKTFDNASDGTGMGEGVATILLKPLDKAIADGDNIHAVIKGGAVNQDGQSVGITAPNTRAQAEVVSTAWMGAQINPEDVSYIEVHGTGTSLGDPIEIEAITNAFRVFTNKKQFCALSAIKPNLGHTLEAAGIFSLLKAVLALKHKQLPPSINLHEPNHKVNWEESAVYVNDKLTDWQLPENLPRICGVSSFGLSGTNCHLILTEAPDAVNHKNEKQLEFFTISAKNNLSFRRLVDQYIDYFEKNKKVDLANVCYTLNTGRGHHEERLLILAESIQALQKVLISFRKNGYQAKDLIGCYSGVHKTVSDKKKEKTAGGVTEKEIRIISGQADEKLKKVVNQKEVNSSSLEEVCQLYIQGARINWERLYQSRSKQKLSLPTYPFLQNRCWPELDSQTVDLRETNNLKFLHPLLEKCLVRSAEQDIYSTMFSPKKHFVLGDHIINGSHVLPGTVYLEIAKQISKLYYGDVSIELKNISFITPVIMDKDERKEVQIVVQEQGGFKKFFAISRLNAGDKEKTDKWIRHVEGEIHPAPEIIAKQYKLEDLKDRCQQKSIPVDINKIAAGFIEFGLRWQNYHRINLGENEALAELELPRECLHDLEEYFLHPSMLDMAVAAASMALGFRALPFSYERVKVYGPMPGKMYSYFKWMGEYDEVEETVGFDLDLLDQHGRVFAEIKNFKLKRTRDFRRVIAKSRIDKKDDFYQVAWRQEKLEKAIIDNRDGVTLVLGGKKELAQKIISRLEKVGNKIIQIDFGSRYQEISTNKFVIRNQLSNYVKLIEKIKSKKIVRIVHLASLNQAGTKDLGKLVKSQKQGVFSLFYVAKALSENVINNKVDIILLSQYADVVTGKEITVKPENATLFGFGKTISLEDPNFQCRAIDVGDFVDINSIVTEINSPYSFYKVAYRDDLRYVEGLKRLDMSSIKNRPVKIRNNGTYIITGGRGGMGLSVATKLAASKKINLVLWNRTEFPKREEWRKILKNNNKNEKKIKETISQIHKIEKNGSRVLMVSADVTDYIEAKEVIEKIKNKFDNINGVIHAAGVAGAGFINTKEELSVKNVLAPKVQGTWILDKLTRKEPLDFFVLFSSTTALHSAPGQSDYTAANAYLDSFAHWRQKKNKNTLVINWSGWKEVGMSVDNESIINYQTLSPEEALDAFLKVLNKDLVTVTVGSLSYVGRIVKDLSKLPIELSSDVKMEIRQNSLSSEDFNHKRDNRELKIKGASDGQYKEMEKTIAQIWSEVLGIKEIDLADHFFDLGGDSLRIAEVHSLLEKKYPGKFSVAELFAYPTITQLVAHVEHQQGQIGDDSAITSFVKTEQDIAIIGMAAKTSLAKNLDEFWENLIKGKDCIRDIPAARKVDTDNYLRYKGLSAEQRKYHQVAYLEEIDKFDYEYFQISPREAELMDPNQRVLLETVYHSLENAGYGGRRLQNTKTGLYVGLFPLGVKYYDWIAEVEPQALSEAMVNNMDPTIASRISYYLNLTGPNMLVNTACSSSLVAAHLACQAIRNGECDQAIVGSVKISLLSLANNPQVGIESKNGHTHTFDNSSDGTGLGEGAASIVLKPLAKALEDRDRVLAVIKGSAINQDGRSTGITAPNALAQTEVILSAWQQARIKPESISYMEAHGTGTNLGDPIEIEAIADAFRRFTNKKQFCAIGSVKSNLGHLLEAAGIFGLIKSVLALNHKIIPPTINFHEPNHKVSWEKSPVYINDRAINWPSDERRRLGISSFGLSGTNCHLVLEEAPASEIISSTSDNQELQIFVLSARSKKVLRELVEGYLKYFSTNPKVNLADVCYTVGTGRAHNSCRLAIVTKSLPDLRSKLKKVLADDFLDINLEQAEFNEFKVVPYGQKIKQTGEITEREALNWGKELDIVMREFLVKEKMGKELARKICHLYVKGATFNWLGLYQDKKYRKVDLPVYPFEKKRCWLDIPGAEKYPDYYQKISWRKQERTGKTVDSKGTTLVLLNDNPRAQEIAKELKKKGDVIEISLGKDFKKINDKSYVIKNDKDDYKLLLEELNEIKITRIVHLLTLKTGETISSLEELNISQEDGIYSLLFLVQTLQNKLSLQTLDLSLVSEYVDSVTGNEEVIKPENATLVAFGKAVSLENPNFLCHAIDIDEKTSLDNIIQEINTRGPVYKIAFRNNERYIEELVKFDPTSASDNFLVGSENEINTIRKNGVYLITGGLGGIGLAIAKQFAKEQKVKIILLSRNPMPPKEEWNEILEADGPKDKRLLNKIESLQSLESSGAEVMVVTADVSNWEQMQGVIKSIKERFGAINGIVHAAGMAQEGFIATKGRAVIRNVIASKVQGTWILDRLTLDQELDFFVLFSSAITLVSGIGVSDYTAANAFLDSYAEYAHKQKRRMLVINWATWDNIGLSFQEKVEEKKQLLKIISSSVALEILLGLIKKKIRRAVVGKLNYEGDMFFLGDYLPLNFSEEIKAKTRKASELLKKQVREVKLKGRENDNYSQIEKQLAQIWSEVFGYKEIDIRDNFFELGGDSLSGIRLIAKVNSQLQRSLSFREILQNPTLKSLAIYLTQSETLEYTPVIKPVEPKKYRLK